MAGILGGEVHFVGGDVITRQMGPDARGLGWRHLLLVAHVARQLGLGVDVLAVHLPVLPASTALGGTLQRQLLRLITQAFLCTS